MVYSQLSQPQLSGTWYQVSGTSTLIKQRSIRVAVPCDRLFFEYLKNVVMCQEYVTTGTAVVLFDLFFPSLWPVPCAFSLKRIVLCLLLKK